MAVQKVYPLIAELSTLNNSVHCTESGCSQLFTSESNLTLHLVKVHKRSELWLVKKVFYCPITDCSYNKSSTFKSIKPLRQHYMKVHMDKKFVCDKCNKSFITHGVLKSHENYCGIQFTCLDCDVSYSSYETLQTHGRRKKHSIKDKKDYRVGASSVMSRSVCQYRLILPKSKINDPISSSKFKIVLSQGSQTEAIKPKLKSRSIQVESSKIDSATQVSKMTQTNFIESNSLETQTCDNNYGLSLKHELEDYIEPQKRKSIKVQTNLIESKTSACNTSFDLNDFEFTLNSEIEKLSSSTQTTSQELVNNYSCSTMTHDSIHTDTSDLLMYGLNENLGSYDTSFFNCNMETQTDILDNDLFNYCDYYSNHMYTQTCDDILGSSVFIDSETQTKLNEMFSSVESQTIMSQVKLEDKDRAHIETQTDTEFNIKLEEIHS